MKTAKSVKPIINAPGVSISMVSKPKGRLCVTLVTNFNKEAEDPKNPDAENIGFFRLDHEAQARALEFLAQAKKNGTGAFYKFGREYFSSFHDFLTRDRGGRALHRVGGPALTSRDIFRNEQREYRQNGILHRTDGPARILVDSSSGSVTKEYYIQGKLHRVGGPARVVEEKSDDLSKTVLKEYYQDGKPYREEGPTSIKAYFAREFEGKYYVEKIEEEYLNAEGEAHREGAPAIIFRSGDGCMEDLLYVQNGVIHREDGPANIRKGLDGYLEETYFQNGVKHRADGPAHIIRNRNGNGSLKEAYFQNGRKHRENGPAYISRSHDGYLEEIYFQNDVRHRIGGPAYIMTHEGRRIGEKYYCEGKLHRADGPAWVQKAAGMKLEPGDGIATLSWLKNTKRYQNANSMSLYFVHGVLHRDEGPAVKIAMEQGGSAVRHYHNGKLDCADGPAIVEKIGKNYVEEYYKDGNISRADGPARTEIMPDKKKEFFYEGRKIREVTSSIITRSYSIS